MLFYNYETPVRPLAISKNKHEDCHEARREPKPGPRRSYSILSVHLRKLTRAPFGTKSPKRAPSSNDIISRISYAGLGKSCRSGAIAVDNVAA